MNYIQYMKPGSNFNPSQWDFNKVDKSRLTPEQIAYAVEQYFWRTKDPEMKKQFELWSDYQKRVNASQNADPMSDIAASVELPEVTITMAKPNYIDQIKSDIRNKWANMSTEDKVHAGIDAATTIGGFIPGVDVVADGVDLIHSLQRKDWAGAGIGTAAMVLPFVSAPMLRKIKTISNTLFSPEAQFARTMNKNIKHSKPINPDKLPDEVNTGRIKKRDYVPYSTAGGDYFYHNSGLRGDVPRQYNKFHGAFASRSFGRNADETFLSYGMPWPEHDAGIMYEFPGDILPDWQYMTDQYGKPTIGLVKPFGKSQFELSAIKTPNTPDYPFIDIRTGEIVDNKTALGDPLKLRAMELNIGGSQTTIPTEQMRQILQNTNYKVWRAPSKLYPFGAKELHLGNLTTTPDFHFDNPMYDYITGKPIYFYKSGGSIKIKNKNRGKLNYLNLFK